jgi:methyl-accepting chemotaxis protein
MFSRFSLAARLNLINAVVACIALGGLAANMIVQQRYIDLTKQAEIVAKAARYQALADMHHDGVKGALYRILHAVTFNSDGVKDARDDLEKQSESLKSRLAQLKALNLPHNIREAMASIDKPLLDYLQSAAQLAKTAIDADIVKANKSLPAFEVTFEALAVIQDKLGEGLEKETVALTEASQQLAEMSKEISLGIGAAFILLFIGLFLFVRRQVTSPLTVISGLIRQITSGNMQVEIDAKGRHDEVGAIFQALTNFRDQSKRAQDLEIETASARQILKDRQDKVEAAVVLFQTAISQTRASLSAGIGHLRSASGELSAVAADAEQGTQSSARSSEENTVVSQQIAQATSELNSSILEVARQITVASTAVSSTSELAAVSSTNVTQLASAADEIDSVIDLIRAIAEQTNLLALNATIEAARAGDAGRGFAVVATEVKTLASQTAQATNDIAAQIMAIKTNIGSTVKAIGAMVSTFSQVEGAIGSITSAMDLQSSTAREIAQAAEAAANGVTEMNGFISSVVEVVERSHTSARVIQSVSEELGTRSSDLGHSVDRFLVAVEAA